MQKPNNLPLKVMQFGGGNFLRAFVDWMIQILNEQTDFRAGVVIVKPTERGDYAALKSQKGCFHVVLDGIKNGNTVSEIKRIDCVRQVINPYVEWDAYIDLAKNPDLRFIVSNTTEAGIAFNATDTIDSHPPIEFPAKLTHWLYHRFQHFGGDHNKGCIILPCELLEENGLLLKKTILQYADFWQLEDPFKIWIDTANYFCNTLVDRIVSGYPEDRADAIHKKIGCLDKLLVAGEYYHNWVIQGDIIARKELPFSETDLNVAFVADIAPYREMKVCILNGAHTAMVPVGYLAGCRRVDAVMDESSLSAFVTNLLREEVLPTLDFPKNISERFVNDVLDRFRNPVLKHQLHSISLNSTTKFKTRLLPTLKAYVVRKGQLPERIVLGLAALIRFYKGSYNGSKIVVMDNPLVIECFDEAWSQWDAGKWSCSKMITFILGKRLLWGEDLNQIGGLNEMVTGYINTIESNGIRAALASCDI